MLIFRIALFQQQMTVIVIKNASWLGNTGVMKNIKISDCEIISRTNAIKVGTETTYDISDIYINDCKLFMTDLYPGSVSGHFA